MATAGANGKRTGKVFAAAFSSSACWITRSVAETNTDCIALAAVVAAV